MSVPFEQALTQLDVTLKAISSALSQHPEAVVAVVAELENAEADPPGSSDESKSIAKANALANVVSEFHKSLTVPPAED